MTPLEHALAYARLGWRVVPCPPGYKYPHGIPDWQIKATTDETRITAHWGKHPDHGVCIATGPGSGIVVIDIDTYAGGDDGWAELTRGREVSETVEAITGRGGRHLVFADPAEGPTITNAAGSHMPIGIDVRGDGGQIVVAPTIHPDTGIAYAWEVAHDPLDGFPVAALPDWLRELLQTPPPEQRPREDRPAYAGADSIIDRFAADHTWPQLLGSEGWTFHSRRAEHGTGETFELWTRPGKDVRAGASASLYYRGSDVLKVFTSSCPPLEPEATYTRFGFWAAIHHGGDHSAAGRAYRRQIGGAVVTGKPPTSTTAHPAGSGTDDEGEATDEQVAQPYTDLGNARRLVAGHGPDLRYAPELGCWLVWDGHRWAEDVTGEVHRRAKQIVDGMITQLAGEHMSDDQRKKLVAWWMKSQMSARLESMVQVARTEPEVPVRVRQLDADPWVWNTLAGAVDLRTGEITAQARGQLVTKLAAVHPTDTGCPTWVWFLDWAMRGDQELVAFLRRAVGYSLTGTVGEQCLFFLHGSGANGKSTFLNVLQALTGDYAISAEADLLLATTHERHSTGIADLVGRRVVVVQETDEGRRLDEAVVKRLTGGDVIRARRMRQDNFEFHPSHKLWMAANHRPMVRGTDHAIWRRIRMIPFLASVAPDAQDDGLLGKLLAELPGIARWAIEGCREWQREGLHPPAAVVAATQEYRTEQDHIGRFLDDVCVLDPSFCVGARELRVAYEKWCSENGEHPWSAKRVGPQLGDRGCTRVQVGREKSWTWIGITLVDHPTLTPASVSMSRAGLAAIDGAAHQQSVNVDDPRRIQVAIDAAHAAHPESFQWAAPTIDLPGAIQSAADAALPPRSPYAHAHDGGYTENGPEEPRQAALDEDELF